MAVEKLITLVAQNPIIYDTTSFYYRDQLKKNDAWDKIAEELGWTDAQCRTKWKSLRSQYRKEKQKDKTRKKSGAAGGSVHVWRYATILGFLDPFMEERPTSSNMEKEQEAVEETEQDEEQAENQDEHENQASAPQETASQESEHMTRAMEGTSRRKRARESPSDFDERLLQVLEAVNTRNSNQPICPPSPALEDGDDLFFRGLVQDFKSLSVRTRQALKFEIHRLIFEAKQREDLWEENSHMTML